MDIYTYLKKDHRKVSKLFRSIISSNTNKERQSLFFQLKQELMLHAEPEHYTFYEALRPDPIGEEDAKHGDQEHSKIKKALEKLSKIPPNETIKWCVQLGELKHIVEHHVEDEENKMFNNGKNIISENEAEELAIKIKKLKEEIIQSTSFKNKYAHDKQLNKNRRK